MGVRVEWLASSGAKDSAADLTLDGEHIGRVYHEGISWTIVVHGRRAGGYASVAQIRRDAGKMHREWVKARVASERV